MIKVINKPGPTRKFRLRPGFTLFRNREEMDLYKAGGRFALGIKPRAVGGDIVELNGQEIVELREKLGMFEPICEAAKRAYAGVNPIQAQATEVVTRAEMERRGFTQFRSLRQQ